MTTDALRGLFLSLLLCSIAVKGFADYDLNKPIPSLELQDGRTLRNVKIVSYATETIMARWDGGMGTVKIELLPEELQNQISPKVPDKKPKSERPNQTAQSTRATPAAQSSGTLQISDIALKAIDSSGDYVTFGWTARVYNGSNTAKRFRTQALLYDAQQFELDFGYSDEFTLRPGENKTVSGRGLTKQAQWQATKSYVIRVQD